MNHGQSSRSRCIGTEPELPWRTYTLLHCLATLVPREDVRELMCWHEGLSSSCMERTGPKIGIAVLVVLGINEHATLINVHTLCLLLIAVERIYGWSLTTTTPVCENGLLIRLPGTASTFLSSDRAIIDIRSSLSRCNSMVTTATYDYGKCIHDSIFRCTYTTRFPHLLLSMQTLSPNTQDITSHHVCISICWL